MAVRLLVTRTANPSEPDEYVFEQETITVGRDSSSLLILPDQRRVVSKQHAEIRRSGNYYQLYDLASKNFTFLNEERLQPSKPYDLYPGDVFKIGEYEIRFETVEERKEPDNDRTVFDFSFVNPFDEPAAQLAELLQSIRARYDQEAPNRRTDALRDALARAAGQDHHETDALIAGSLGLMPPPQAAGASPFQAAGPAPGAPSHASSRADAPTMAPVAPRTAAQPAGQASQPAYPGAAGPGAGMRPSTSGQRSGSGTRPMASSDLAGVPSGRLERVADMLLRAFAKVAGIPWQFRHEFIGQTIIQSADSSAVHSGNPDALRSYLLDLSLPEEEVERRLAFVEGLIEELALHQLALLDGYRASVQLGAQQLLGEMDPEQAEQQAERESRLNALVPIMRKARAAAIMSDKKKELEGEDWTVAERRVFRPAFIKSYLARMTAMRR